MDIDFNKIQIEILTEAQKSPNLLSDLAGLEEYIAETYNNRSFIELLQNADDAGSTCFYINQVNEDVIIVANNGREFSREDIISICRSASSSKKKEESIGYRGIGFKSIVGLANYVHIISGEYAISFSREKTSRLIPSATRVPLIRIPHVINNNIIEKYKSVINDLDNKGFTSIFIFSGLKKYAIDSEIEAFNPISLLFLKNVLSVDIIVKGKNIIEVNKRQLIAKGGIEHIDISDKNDNSSKWRLYRKNSTSIAFKIVNEEIIKLNPQEALVSAFLPTEDTTGLGILINGNFSTDPSRRHVIFDKTSINSINEISEFITSIMRQALENYSSKNYHIVDALTPYTTPQMFQFQKMSFSRYLIETIAKYSKDIIIKTYITPTWLNIKDYELITKYTKYKTLDRHYYELAEFISYLKYLGAKEISISELITLNLSLISNIGCAEIVKQIIKESIPSYIVTNEKHLKLPIFVCNNTRYSLEDIKSKNQILDKTFIDLLFENVITEIELRIFFKQNASINSLNNLTKENSNIITKSQENENNEYPIDTAINIENINYAINKWLSNISKKNVPSNNNTKWRSSEIQAKEILNSIGFNLQDVSKQNIGYDLEGTDPNGHNIMIEVKSINNPGDRFELTNNEIALAQEKRNRYYIAIVRLKGDSVEMMLIADPVNNLELERQAVQWRWVCFDYIYEPIDFKL